MDFDSFTTNGYKLKEHFETQGWINYFNILNDPTYSFLVRDFWVRAEIYDDYYAMIEEIIVVENYL